MFSFKKGRHQEEGQSSSKEFSILRFIIFAIILGVFPVLILHINTSSYFGDYNDYIQKTNHRLNQILESSVPQEEQIIDLQALFQERSKKSESALSTILTESTVIILLTLLFTGLLSYLYFKKILYHYLNPIDIKVNEESNEVQEEQGVTPIEEEFTEEEVQFNNDEDYEDFDEALIRLLEKQIYSENTPVFHSINIATHLAENGQGGYYSFLPINDDKIAFMLVEPQGEKKLSLFLSNYSLFFFKQEFKNYAGPEHFCNAFNKRLHEIVDHLNISIMAFVGVMDLKNFLLSYTNCGYRGMIYFDSSGNGIQSIANGDIPLGEDTIYDGYELQLMQGDRLLFYNRPISIMAHQGNFSLKVNEDNSVIIEESSFHDLLEQLPEIVKMGKVGETTVLFELLNSYKDNYSSVSLYFETGTKSFLEEDYKAALEAFERVMKINPKHLRALTNIGLIYYKQSNYEKARDAWRKVLEMDPNMLKVKRNLEILEKKISSLSTEEEEELKFVE